MATTKDFCKERYVSKREQLGCPPSAKEFYTFAGVDKRELATLYGSSAYSKLQKDCGDSPNRLEMVRTSLDDIMRQYATVARNKPGLPTGADWSQGGCKPTETGLRRGPYRILWSEMPERFREWADALHAVEYRDVLGAHSADTGA